MDSKNIDTKITLQIRHYLIKYVDVDLNAVICINLDKAGSKFIWFCWHRIKIFKENFKFLYLCLYKSENTVNS